jgi:hypothetical protein
MKTKDLFAGCSVTIAPHDDVWLVSLVTDMRATVSMLTYHSLADAIEDAYAWAMMLSDEKEITPDPEGAMNVLMEAVARDTLGEDIGTPKTFDEALTRDNLRAWFEHDMGEG